MRLELGRFSGISQLPSSSLSQEGLPCTSPAFSRAELPEATPAFREPTRVVSYHPVLWPPDSKSHLIRKDPDAGKD